MVRGLPLQAPRAPFVRLATPAKGRSPSGELRLCEGDGGAVWRGPDQSENEQRRVGRNLVLFTIPLILVSVLSVVLIWEIVRINLGDTTKTHWPWRLTLLDLQSVSNMLALTAGLAFARAQYARAVRPLIGWSGNACDNTYRMAGTHVWLVNIHNGGTHNATVERVDYRVEPKRAESSGWLDHDTTVMRLEGLDLLIGKDFDLNTFGYGGLLGSVYVGRFSARAVEVLDDLCMRVRVVDAVGDHHERVIFCLFSAAGELRSARASGDVPHS